MTWEETIQFIRTQPEYNSLVEHAYFDEDLRLNIERFGKSDEYMETLRMIKSYAPEAQTILDIGAGNGISSLNFAIDNYHVTAIEPDPSSSIGANAIRSLTTIYDLENIFVHEGVGEYLEANDNSFDVVYIRQAMHHANDLQKFICECSRVLKPEGILITVRDHVIIDQTDKELFLASHPLHKFYGGENAFTAEEYRGAIEGSGLRLIKELKYYDSVINYFPMKERNLEEVERRIRSELFVALKNKISIFAYIPGVFYLYRLKNGFGKTLLNEKKVPGRMYSYIAEKPCKNS